MINRLFSIFAGQKNLGSYVEQWKDRKPPILGVRIGLSKTFSTVGVISVLGTSKSFVPGHEGERVRLTSKILAEPILVGRNCELQELQKYLDCAIDGKGRTVFISGEAGSGKTRLTSEFLKSAKKKGIAILSGWCLSNAAVPYFPFVEAFDSYVSENNEASKSLGPQQLGLKTWLLESSPSELMENQGAVSPQAWKDQKFAAVTKELLFASTDKPLILFIDDLHWADSASLALMHYIAKTIGPERIMILATFRSEELSPRDEGFVHPLLDTLRLMAREDLFHEVKLLNLSQSDVGRIAENMLDGKVRDELVEKLVEESQGNPLFVIESLRLLFEDGTLAQENGQWRISSDKIGTPAKVKDIILRRLSALKANQRRTLDVASVIGDKFEPQLLGAVLNQDSLEVLETLNTIALSKSLVRVEGDYYKFDHAKSREVLYEEILLPLKKGYHERIAEKIESASGKTKILPVSDLAYHYIQAGNKEKSVPFALRAGVEALTRFSNAEAIKYFTYVLQNAAESAADKVEEKLAAMEGLGDAYYAAMMFKEAGKTYEELEEIGGPFRMRALRKAMESAFFQNNIPHLVELLKHVEVEKIEPQDRLENARIEMNRGRVFVMQGRPFVGVQYFEKALRVFEEEYSVWDTAWDLIALGSNLPNLDNLEGALAALVRSITLFQELGDNRWLIEAYNMAGVTYVSFFGFWEKGLEMFEKASKINEVSKVGDYLRLAQLSAEWAWILSSKGDLQGALSKSFEALKYSENTDSSWAKGMAYANLVMYCTVLGDMSRAEVFFGKLMQLPPEVLLNPLINSTLASAMFLAGKNQWKESMQIFGQLFDHFKTFPLPGVEAMTKMSYAWALSKQGHFELAGKQVQESQKIYEDINKRFEHFKVQASLMAPTKVKCDQPFEIRFDLVNVSRARGVLIRVENVSVSDFQVTAVSQGTSLIQDAFHFAAGELEPFGIKSVKLSLVPARAGVFNFSPKAIYVDDLGATNVLQVKPVRVTVVSVIGERLEKTAEGELESIVFKSEASQKAFDFLISAFKEDYLKRRLPQERSGWRTLMDLVREGKISKYSVYGFSGKRGQTVTELERAGLVEGRVFTGERGRGGEIFKIRIAYEREIVRRQVTKQTE
jgi:tetratricopeptide (TPR) repeat protein